MSQIKIPTTIEGAIKNLDGVGQLLQAKNWERAALVYAFTRPGQRGGVQTNDGSPPLTITAFAALGITGLTNRETVSDYREAWESAMQDGAPDVKPGDTITAPNLPWPPGTTSRRTSHATTAEVEAGVAKMIEEQPEKLVKELVENARDVLVETIAETPAVADEITEAAAEVRAARSGPEPTPTLNAERVLHTVIKALDKFWTREVQAGPDRLTFQQVVETVIQNRQSPTLRSRVVPTVMLDNELMEAITNHIAKSADIRDGKTLTTGMALVGEGE